MSFPVCITIPPMPAKLSHPFRCEFVPQFNTKHEAHVFIEAYQADGHIKHCGHLSVGTYGDGFSERYGPKCAEHSFNSLDNGYRESLFHGCPTNCRLYEPAWRHRIKKSFKNCWWPLRRGIVGTADWYKSLAPVTQALWAFVILGILALLGLPLFEMILRALGVVFG